MDMNVATAQRRHTVRWADPAPMAALRRARTGYDYFHAVATGALPQPPIYDLFGFRLAGLEPGVSHFVGELDDHLLNPFGTVHGGYSATFLDSVSGVGLQSMLPLGRGTVTIRLEVSYLRPILPAMKQIHGTSRIIRIGRRVAWAEADITAPDGTVLVRSRGRFAIFPTEPGPPIVPAAPVYTSREIAWGDPGQARRALKTMTGVEFVRAQADGRVPLAPFHVSAAYGPVAAGEGRATYRCVPQLFHYNPMGGVHGGLAAILVDTAGGAAIHSVQPVGTGATAVNIWIDYFRPITLESGPLLAEGTLVHAGPAIGVADVEVKDAAGAVCARGGVTYYCFPIAERR
jgi:uncharacterized protein (TIGR00369 family)